jgi:hypothetical protein
VGIFDSLSDFSLSCKLTHSFSFDPLSQGGTLQKHRAVLPKFAALEHISMGSVKKTVTRANRAQVEQLEKDKQQDSLPFAVVPLERMAYDQLRQAFKDRGIQPPKQPSYLKFRTELERAGFSLAQEASIQNSKQVQHLQGIVKDLSAKKKDALAVAAKVEKQMDSDKLYCTMHVADMKTAMLSFQKPGERKLQKRDDLAQALHAHNYLGGGTPKQMLTYIQKTEARLSKKMASANQRIKGLQAAIQNFVDPEFNDENAAPAKPKASSPLGSKRSIADVN